MFLFSELLPLNSIRGGLILKQHPSCRVGNGEVYMRYTYNTNNIICKKKLPPNFYHRDSKGSTDTKK